MDGIDILIVGAGPADSRRDAGQAGGNRRRP